MNHFAAIETLLVKLPRCRSEILWIILPLMNYLISKAALERNNVNHFAAIETLLVKLPRCRSEIL